MMEMEGFADHSDLLRPGVYALGWRGRVVYVGKAKCLLARIYTHRSVWGKQQKGQRTPEWLPIKGMLFDEIRTFPCRMDQLDAVETHMIELYKPQYNRLSKTPGTTTRPFDLSINGISLGINQPDPSPIPRRAL